MSLHAAPWALCLLLPTPLALAAPPAHPEGAPTPRSLTPAEARWLRDHPLAAPSLRATAPPTGPLRAPAEYEPMESIIIAWEGPGSWLSILAQMGAAITTTGDADLYVYVDSPAEAASASAALASAGADPARVITRVFTTDTIWCRDYGPQYAYEGGVRVALDHTYNRPRPNDNALPADFAALRNHPYYDAPLVHGGGNYQLVADATGYATELIADENPSLTPAQIAQIWHDYWGIDTTLTDALPAFIDSTQHIDMWLQMAADDHAVVSDWPAQSGTAQDLVCDTWAAELALRGFTVTRVPARSVSGVHYTYTNVVICNDLVLVPTYTNTTIVNAGYNAQALAAWAAVYPSKTITPINCQAIVSSAGVMHCITKHVPANSAAEHPVAFLRSPGGGQSFDPDQTVTIAWSADDDEAVTGVDLLLSTNAGATFTPIATALPAHGAFGWTVPDIGTTQALLRAVAHDAQGRTGTDDSDPFTITGTPPCPADLTGDGVLTLDDLDAFAQAFFAGSLLADCDASGTLTLDDLDCFIAAFAAGCP